MFARNYRLLDYFVHIGDSGSLKNAAEKIHVSPPVISKALADLEELLNATLIVRGTGQLELTDSGRQVYERAKQMSLIAAETISMTRSLSPQTKGETTITLPSELSLHWLPEILSGFQKKYPSIKTVVLSSDKEVDLKEHNCDFAIRAEFSLSSQQPKDDVFARLPITLICSPNLMPDKTTSVEELCKTIPFVGFTFRRSNQVLLAEEPNSSRSHRLKVRTQLEINSAFFGKELALQGLGMALVIEPCNRADLEQGRLVRVAPELDFGQVNLKLVYRDQYPSESAMAFGQFILDFHNTDA